MIEGEPMAVCPECGGLIWIAHPGGEAHLMRMAEIPIDECVLCTRAHEMVS